MFKAFENAAWYNNADRDDVAEELLLDAPTIDAEPVVHGRWIKSDFLHIGANQYRCSECWEDKWWLYHFSLGDSNYCPNCGAKMDEVSERWNKEKS